MRTKFEPGQQEIKMQKRYYCMKKQKMYKTQQENKT